MSIFLTVMLSVIWVMTCWYAASMLMVRAIQRMQDQIEELNRRLDALTDDMK